MRRIYVLHENDQWFKPLAKVFDEYTLPYESFPMDSGSIDLSSAPPDGVFFSKMSASSYLRGHAQSPDFAFIVFAWLKAHGRRVINGASVLRLEISKMDQYLCLQTAGIPVPRSIACFGIENIEHAAQKLRTPLILKPNRGGKGAGVKLFQSITELKQCLAREDDILAESVDGIIVLQEYIQAPEPFITRLEFIGGKFVYAVRVDTSEGFELCPAEACRRDTPTNAPAGCALDGDAGLFRIMKDFQDPIIGQLEDFLRLNEIEVAGVEFIRDSTGLAYVYDINTNTNYNPAAERHARISAAPKLAEFLRNALENS